MSDAKYSLLWMFASCYSVDAFLRASLLEIVLKLNDLKSNCENVIELDYSHKIYYLKKADSMLETFESRIQPKQRSHSMNHFL